MQIGTSCSAHLTYACSCVLLLLLLLLQVTAKLWSSRLTCVRTRPTASPRR
jgi:hypothetical protein